MKHILDWYNKNTPQNEDEYEKGCLTSAAIIAIIFIGLFVQVYTTKSKQSTLYFQVYDINNSKGVIRVPEVKEYWQIKKNLFELDD